MNKVLPDTAADAHNWKHQAQSKWQRGDTQGAIDEVLAVINRSPKQDKLPLVPCLHLAYYLYQLGDFGAGEEVLTRLLQQYPDDLETLENRAVLRIRRGDLAAAIEDFQLVVQRNPTGVNAWDGLTHALSKLGRWAEAKQAGEHALDLKADRCQSPTASLSWPDISPQTWDDRHQGQDIIAFSLWGNNPTYLRGAVRNLLEAPVVYPGWQCRFYLDNTVPAEFIAFAQAQGGQVVIEESDRSLREKLCWRFQVANDPTVRRFLIRDADAVVNQREAKAVAEWLAGDCWFHIMRDYWTHTDLILAGMWGGRAGLLPAVMQLVRQYQSGRMETANIDQWFLRDSVWPLIRDRVLIHDRIFQTLNAHPWPEADPPGTLHVGQNEAAVDSAGQVSKLGELFDRYAWLRSAAPVAKSSVSTPEIGNICGLWINLDRSTVRRQELERQLQVAGLAGEYQRVAGVEGSQIAPNIARPGVIGCWLGHLRALECGRDSGKVVHILEDDTLLGDRAKELFHALASSPTVLKYDIVFTDVLLDYFTTQRYFKAFAEQAGQVQPGEIPSFIHAIDLRTILFAGANSYFISSDRIGTVLDLLNHTYQHLDPDHPEPIDMAMRRLVRTGKLSAAVTCPFLTSYHLDALADSTIENNADSDLNHTRWLHTIHRQAFFYGADDRALMTQLESQFPTQLSSDKSRLLSLLYEQFLIQSQKSF